MCDSTQQGVQWTEKGIQQRQKLCISASVAASRSDWSIAKQIGWPFDELQHPAVSKSMTWLHYDPKSVLHTMCYTLGLRDKLVYSEHHPYSMSLETL